MSTRRSLLQLRFDDLEAAIGGQTSEQISDYVLGGRDRLPDRRDRLPVGDREVPVDIPPVGNCGCQSRRKRRQY